MIIDDKKLYEKAIGMFKKSMRIERYKKVLNLATFININKK